jgi:hypothetical protein
MDLNLKSRQSDTHHTLHQEIQLPYNVQVGLLLAQELVLSLLHLDVGPNSPQPLVQTGRGGVRISETETGQLVLDVVQTVTK